jgi:hypothetical protein
VIVALAGPEGLAHAGTPRVTTLLPAITRGARDVRTTEPVQGVFGSPPLISQV